MPVTRRALLKALAAAGLGVIGGPAAYGFLYGRHELEVTRATLPVSGLPGALAGLRVGLITDTHRSRWVSHDDIERASRALIAEQPDLIVLGGDYVTWGNRQYVGPSAEAVASLTAPHGVFAILGNHDDDHDMPAALRRKGIQVLRDARTRLAIRGEQLDLVGIRFWTKKQSEIAELVRDASPAMVLLAHDPRRITEAAALNVPLVLAGHTHGGQVVLPGLGAVAARKFPIAAGTLRRERTTMFVSRGVGTIYVPVRIACPPEVAVLTLQPA
jgi:uncharacterized protein